MFVLYREGHSELHTIMSPFELPNTEYWCKRTCEYGVVYHHPDYICYRIQMLPSDRPYDHVLTNAISSYSRYEKNHTIESLDGTIGPSTRIMFVMNNYEEEFPESILSSCIDYDTPICFFGIIPYMIPRLPSHLFELHQCFLFRDTEEITFYTLRVVYQEIPLSIQETIRTRICNQYGIDDIEHTVNVMTVTFSIFPEEWLQTYVSSPHHLVKTSIFSWKTNLLLSMKINQLLFTKSNNIT